MLIFTRDKLCISVADVVLSKERFFLETIAQHSFPISLRKNLHNSTLSSLTLNTAPAMLLQVPFISALPRGSNSVFNFRVFTCEGQVTTTFKVKRKQRTVEQYVWYIVSFPSPLILVFLYVLQSKFEINTFILNNMYLHC